MICGKTPLTNEIRFVIILNMKIPNSLKIGGHTFKVIQKDLKDLSGETNFCNLEIYINKNTKQSVKEVTLLHEIICHCINTTFTGDSHKAHAFMDSISEQIYQVLVDNKLLK